MATETSDIHQNEALGVLNQYKRALQSVALIERLKNARIALDYMTFLVDRLILLIQLAAQREQKLLKLAE